MKRLISKWEKQIPTINGWLSLNNAFGAEIMSYAGFDSLTIDMQHGISDYSSLLPMLQALKGMPCFVRVPWLEEGIIMKTLDAGAMGIICPMINHKEDALKLAKFCHYPPKGERSFGPIRAKFLCDGDYFTQHHLLIFAMIETKQALQNLSDILSVDGIDGVYVGPADLSCALGVAPRFDQEEKIVLEAIQMILSQAKRHKKYAGIHNLGAHYARKMADLGFNFVTIGSDAFFMLDGAKKAVEAFKL